MLGVQVVTLVLKVHGTVIPVLRVILQTLIWIQNHPHMAQEPATSVMMPSVSSALKMGRVPLVLIATIWRMMFAVLVKTTTV